MQPLPNHACRLAVIIPALVSLSLLQGCSSQGFNVTGYPYQYDAVQLPETKKRLLLADVNFGYPSKTYLQQYEGKVDGFVAERLEEHGFELVDDKPFSDAWRAATRKYGTPYNALTAQINRTTFQRVMYETISTLRKDNIADAVVFTDLVEIQVTFGSKLNRNAKWDGVTRKLRFKSGTQGVSPGFDWSQNVPAISLAINIYNVEGKRVLSNRGGIEVSRHISALNGDGRFVRRTKLLKSSPHIREAVELAMHPLIPIENYPAPPSTAENQ